MKRNGRGVYPVVTPDLTEQARTNQQRYLNECRILEKLNKAHNLFLRFSVLMVLSSVDD
jgi:hypothetical protein